MRDLKHTGAYLSGLDFSDVKPVAVRAAFEEIVRYLRLGEATFAHDAARSLRQAADSYVCATRPLTRIY